MVLGSTEVESIIDIRSSETVSCVLAESILVSPSIVFRFCVFVNKLACFYLKKSDQQFETISNVNLKRD